MSLRRALVVLVLAGGGAMATDGAGAAPTLGAATGPATLDLRSRPTFETAVPLVGDATPRTVRVRVTPASLPGGGTAMELDDRMGHPALTVDPPATIGTVGTLDADVACAPKGAYGPVAQQAEIRLPAAATTTVHARFRAGGFTPWPGAPFRAIFTLAGTKGTATTPSPKITSGAHGGLIVLNRPRTPHVGRHVVVTGRAFAANPRARVRLRLSARGRPTRTTTVRPTSSGRFRSARWTATRRGDLRVTAQQVAAPAVRTACATQVHVVR